MLTDAKDLLGTVSIPNEPDPRQGVFLGHGSRLGDHVGDRCELAAQQAGADHHGRSRFPRSREAAGDVSRRLRVCRQVWRMCAPKRVAVYLWSTTSRTGRRSAGDSRLGMQVRGCGSRMHADFLHHTDDVALCACSCEEPGERCIITRRDDALPAAAAPSWRPNTLSFVALGDWGCGETNCDSKHDPNHHNAGLTQAAVSKQMGKAAEEVGSSFVLAMGDNFYFAGVKDVTDPLFQSVWQTRFMQHSLMTPWFVCLGNHDHYGNAKAQIDFSKLGMDPRWVLPSYYYTTVREIPGTSRTLQLVVLDTVILDEGYAREMLVEKVAGGVVSAQVLTEFDATSHVRKSAAVDQLDWIEATLMESSADWLIVLGHYPVFSGGEHGSTMSLVNQVRPMLEKYQVDAYLCGHDHTQQHIENAGVQYYVSGAGALRGSVKPISTTLFAAVDPGFLAFQVAPLPFRSTQRGCAYSCSQGSKWR